MGEQYLSSLYFAITIMSTVGFGDIVAFGPLERFFVMCVMLVASAMVGVVVTGISVVVQRSVEEKRVRRDMQIKATRFLSLYGVPVDLQVRVKQYLDAVLAAEEQQQIVVLERDHI